jgi:hypothetical protein
MSLLELVLFVIVVGLVMLFSTAVGHVFAIPTTVAVVPTIFLLALLAGLVLKIHPRAVLFLSGFVGAASLLAAAAEDAFGLDFWHAILITPGIVALLILLLSVVPGRRPPSTNA